MKKRKENNYFKLNALKFALSGGIYIGLIFAFSTILSIFNVPGFVAFTNILVGMYGWWGYSVSWIGIIFALFYGFIEGFVHLFLFACLYNWMIK